MKNAVTWKAWGATDPGKKRENNEDRILCNAERGIFAVVDGMGGEAAGEIAAQQAVDFIGSRLSQETGTVARRLREAIAGASNEIYRSAERNPSWHGMACVLTLAVIEDGLLHVAHVGDSRLYLIQDGRIRKVTPDHSPVGQREDAGELTEAEAMAHPRRNEVFRDVGSQLHKPDDPDFVEYIQLPFTADAAIILCSDGLSDMLSSNDILQTVLAEAGRPRDGVLKLIAKANAAGGKDNISVIVVEGQNFAASSARFTKKKSDRPEPAFRGFRGRWAFLCIGLLAGALGSFLWNGLQQPGKEEEVVRPEPVTPRIIEVNPSGPEYPTISKALESARPGDRIEVGDGEYSEPIRLKEYVAIAARSPGKAILRIERIPQDVDAAITADGIRKADVSGLIIRVEPTAGIPYGIRVSNSRVNLSNIEISGAIAAGFLYEGGATGTVAGSYVHANLGSGILVTGTASPYLVGNVIFGNGTSKAKLNPGLYVTDQANPEVKRNVFSSNGSEAIRVQRQELKGKMMDNLFAGPGIKLKSVAVERRRP